MESDGAFLKHPESIVVHGNRILLDADDRVFGCAPLTAFDPLLTGYNICSETAFWTRDVMNRCGMLDPCFHFAMDLEFFSRLFLSGQFTKLDAYLGYLRCHADSKSSTIWHVAQEESQRVWQERFQADWLDKDVPSSWLQVLLELLKHPLLIGIPYCYRRFML